MTRRFQFVEGRSAKFWEIDAHGNQVTVRYTKTFDSAGAVQQHVERLVAQKTKKGYVEAA